MIIEITCPFCGANHEVGVDFLEYANRLGGELIQNAMPSLTPTEREQLISHICPKCQEEVFGVEEEPDYEVGFDPYAGCYTDDC